MDFPTSDDFSFSTIFKTIVRRVFLAIKLPNRVPGTLSSNHESKRSSRGVFTNTLGMEFVPVKAAPGILFCRWETRVKDFRTFCEDTDRVHEGPAFPQGDDHPVVNVSYNDAMEFCAWLSEKEGKKYRLPKDHEWSAAVGIAQKEEEACCKEKDITESDTTE